MNVDEMLKTYKPEKRKTVVLWCRIDPKIMNRLNELSKTHNIRRPAVVETILSNVLFNEGE